MKAATLLLVAWFTYQLLIFALSRRPKPVPAAAPDDLLFVFLLPCLNEELVIEASLDRLRRTAPDAAVVVIDDGSDDATADIAARYASDRILLMRRTPPDARKGKGEALNAALAFLRSSPLLDGRRPQDVIVAVLDADGRLSRGAVAEAAAEFRDPEVGAVQIGVRIYNRPGSTLARLQDLEFVTFTDVFQRGRDEVGSVGLGGNGQFARLSALTALGEAPWTRCLTEDLDLGIRLLVGRWRIKFCHTAWVEQQGVVSFRRLIRQRARWFQGHLQCWRHIPAILGSALPWRATADLLHHLGSPAVLLLMSLPAGAVPALLVWKLVAGGGIDPAAAALAFLLSFGMAPLYAYAYHQREPRYGRLRCLLLAHLFSVYTYLWVPAGWIAFARIVTRRRGWAKTARTHDADAPGGAGSASDGRSSDASDAPVGRAPIAAADVEERVPLAAAAGART